MFQIARKVLQKQFAECHVSESTAVCESNTLARMEFTDCRIE